MRYNYILDNLEPFDSMGHLVLIRFAANTVFSPNLNGKTAKSVPIDMTFGQWRFFQRFNDPKHSNIEEWCRRIRKLANSCMHSRISTKKWMQECD